MCIVACFGCFFFSIRRRRIEELKNRAAKEQQWRSQGHLEYTELRDEKEWFEASRENERMVCHFYRGVTWRCQIVDRHLETLAKKHIETKFCKVGGTTRWIRRGSGAGQGQRTREQLALWTHFPHAHRILPLRVLPRPCCFCLPVQINAENCPFLAERLNIVLMPTMILTKDNFCADRIEGFDELGGRDDFTTEDLEKRIAKQQIIDIDEAAMMKAAAAAKKKQKGTKSNPTGKAIYASSSNRRADDSDDEDDNEEDED